MEIYIQFRNTFFSYGSRGFRRMKTWDWDILTEKFELLFEKQHAEVTQKFESIEEAEKSMRDEARKQLIMMNQGAWASFNDNTLPMPDVDAQFDMEPDELHTIQPDKDSDYWASNRKK